MKKENIYNFLQSERFIHEGKSTSDFFGDSYDLFQKGTLKIRFSNSRSTQMVDVGCSFDDNNWYDLALVKALLEGGRKLDKETSFDEHIYFLSENITSIMKLFCRETYSKTKNGLENLEQLRLKQMFPGIDQ